MLILPGKNLAFIKIKISLKRSLIQFLPRLSIYRTKKLAVFLAFFSVLDFKKYAVRRANNFD